MRLWDCEEERDMDWIWISVIITSFHIYIFSYSHLSKVRVKRACNSVKLHSPSQTFWGTMREKVWERESTDPFLEVSICKASKSPHIAFYLHTTFRLSLSLSLTLFSVQSFRLLSLTLFSFFFSPSPWSIFQYSQACREWDNTPSLQN